MPTVCETANTRLAALAFGFAAVSRHRVIGPRQAPVGGPLRGPDEIGRARQMRQRPCTVIVDVADEAKFAARLQDARHRGDGCVLHEAPFPVPPLRPRIGMDQIDPRQRVRRRPRQQFGGVAGEQADIADVVGLDLRQDLRHAVDIGFAADEAGVGKGAALPRPDARRRRIRFPAGPRRPADRTVRRDRPGWRCRYRAQAAAADCSIRSAWCARSLWPLRRPKNEPCLHGGIGRRPIERAPLIAGLVQPMQRRALGSIGDMTVEWYAHPAVQRAQGCRDNRTVERRRSWRLCRSMPIGARTK